MIRLNGELSQDTLNPKQKTTGMSVPGLPTIGIERFRSRVQGFRCLGFRFENVSGVLPTAGKRLRVSGNPST